jgi:peptidoglycan/LPS O-acetylase OafA/YrhL
MPWRAREGSKHVSSSNTQLTLPGSRLRELDLLRFTAALAVMLHHFVGAIAGWGVANHKNMPGLASITHFGNLGVDLFFLISGFVILMSSWGRSIDDFAVSRIVRIFPAYWFAVTLAVVLFLTTGATLLSDPDREGPLTAFLPNLTMLQSGIKAPEIEVVYWTLWAELHFYALIALLVWRGITYRRCVAFMGAWLILSAFSQETQFDLFRALLIPTWAPYFIAGMGFFLIYRFGSNLVLWFLIGMSWALAVYYRTTIVNRDLIWPDVWDTVVLVVVTSVFAVMALVSARKLSWLRWRGCTTLGALTYPLYLLHATVTRPLIRELHPKVDQWTLLGLSCALALLSAYLVHLLIEQPAQRWMRPRLKAAFTQIRDNGVTRARPSDNGIAGPRSAAAEPVSTTSPEPPAVLRTRAH